MAVTVWRDETTWFAETRRSDGGVPRGSSYLWKVPCRFRTTKRRRIRINIRRTENNHSRKTHCNSFSRRRRRRLHDTRARTIGYYNIIIVTTTVGRIRVFFSRGSRNSTARGLPRRPATRDLYYPTPVRGMYLVWSAWLLAAATAVFLRPTYRGRDDR